MNKKDKKALFYEQRLGMCSRCAKVPPTVWGIPKDDALPLRPMADHVYVYSQAITTNELLALRVPCYRPKNKRSRGLRRSNRHGSFLVRPLNKNDGGKVYFFHHAR